MGSDNEIEYFPLLARGLNYFNAIDHAALLSQVREIKRMLSGLPSRLRIDRLKLGA